MTSCRELPPWTWPWDSGTTWCSSSSSSPPSTRPALAPAQAPAPGAPGDPSPPSRSRALVPLHTPPRPPPSPAPPPQTRPPHPRCPTQRRSGRHCWALGASTQPRPQPRAPPTPWRGPGPCLISFSGMTSQTKPRHQTHQMPSVGSPGAAGTAGQQQPGGQHRPRGRPQRAAGSRKPRNQSLTQTPWPRRARTWRKLWSNFPPRFSPQGQTLRRHPPPPAPQPPVRYQRKR